MPGGTDLFHPDGFTAAQMIVHALRGRRRRRRGDDHRAGGLDRSTASRADDVRAEDHALLQPMFQAKLTGSGTDLKAELVKALTAADATPPPVAFKG